MKTWIYVFFYCFTLVNIAISLLIRGSLASLLLVITTFCIGDTNSLIQLTTDLKIFGFLFYLVPIFIFLFQLIQDLNYLAIHHLGYWAKEQPLANYRGIHFPQFDKMELQHAAIHKQIKKSRYTLRLFSIVGWVFSALAGELFFVAYLVTCMLLKLPFQPIIPLLLVAIIEILFFAFWEKQKKKRKLTVAYIENQRIFYYQRK